MPDYSTISDGTAGNPSGAIGSGEMTRHRRGGHGHRKDGGHGRHEATMVSSVINLLNTIIGAGTLAMPSALSHFGIVLGVIVIVWSGFTSAFGLYLQSRCSRYLDRGSSSFFALSQMTYPNAAVIFDAAIAIKCFGVGVSYMIIIGDLMPGVALGFDSRAQHLPFLMDRNFWITAFMLVIIPLAFLRRLDSLKYTSVVALVSIGYLIILVVYHFAADIVPDRGPVRVFTPAGPISALSTLPVVIFAYTCHQNMFSILNEISDNTPGSIMGVIGSSIGSAASVYILVSITGYLTFGDDVQGNIVGMYAPSIASTIGKAAIVVLVTFSIPLQVHPCRASIDAVLKWRPNAISRGPQNRSNSPGGHPLLPGGQTRSDHGPASPISDLRFALLTTVILVLSYFVALTVTSLERVLAYVGSTGSTSISFILPGLFYYKISDPNSIHHQRLMKENDEYEVDASSDSEGERERDDETGEMGLSVTSLRSAASGRSVKSARGIWRLRRRWRWDMEHISHTSLRKAAVGLAVYGLVIMVLCLVLNTFVSVAH